jgi:uncharacterized membrane protein YfcA
MYATVASLFAMPPPQVLLIWPVGFLLVVLAAWLFVTASGGRRKGREQDRRAGLGLLSILCGPPAGAGLAWSANALGGVHPVDVGYTYVVFTIVGSVAGLIAGIIFCVTALRSPRNHDRKSPPTRWPDVVDESQ